jgi:phage terminase Nu1 subunit (DNA packaging protein)
MKKWITRREVAALLKVQYQTLSKWACAVPRRGPRFVIRRHRAVYRLDDVFAWLADPAAHEAGHQRDERDATGTN